MRQVSHLFAAAILALAASAASSAPATLGAHFTFTGTGGSASGSIYDGAIHSGSPRDVCSGLSNLNSGNWPK